MNPDLPSLERELARLRPVPHRINRDALMFHAGRAAARRERRRGSYFGAFGFLAGGVLLGLLVSRPQTDPGPPLVQSVPPAVRTSLPPPTELSHLPALSWPSGLALPGAYVALRNRMVAEGDQALPPARWALLPNQSTSLAAGDGLGLGRSAPLAMPALSPSPSTQNGDQS